MTLPSTLQGRQIHKLDVRRLTRPGFSLIELLVVMFIIVLVISIVVPALSKARQATRVTATDNLMSNVLTSASTFQQDNRRLPGRFGGRDMGSDDNGNTRGMTMAENVMLDLAGGIVQVGGSAPASGGVLVHPFASSTSTRASQEGCWVDLGLIGQPTKSGKGYFVPDNKYFVAQTDAAQVGKAGDPADNANKQTYPDLVDAFGQPLLIWIEDESVVGKVAFDSSTSGPNNFARVSSTTPSNAPPARHYWNSNAGFLKSAAFGKKQTDVKAGSLIGADSTTRDTTLAGLLGNPAAATDIGSLSAAKDYKSILPTASRGKIIVQAAGPDGIFLSNTDARGRGQIKSGETAMYYGFNFVDPAATTKLRVDASGRPQTVDVALTFDDQITSGGS